MSWNKNSAKVLGITAAAAMALSLTPAAAFTAAAAPAKAGSSVSAQAVESKSDFEGGHFTKALVDYNEEKVTSRNLITVVRSDHDVVVIPTQVVTLSGVTINLTPNYDNDGNVESLYDQDGQEYTLTPESGSNHFVTLKRTFSDGVGELKLNINTVKASLDGAKAYNKDTDDTTNANFVYDGKTKNVGFAINGKILTAGTDYTVKYVRQGHPNSEATTTAPTDAGTWVALLKGVSGSDYEGQNHRVTFTIQKLNLATATVTLPDKKYLASGMSTEAPTLSQVFINGTRLDPSTPAAGVAPSAGQALASQVNALEMVTDAQHESFGDKGTYTYKLSAKSGQNNIEGTANITFKVVDHVVDSNHITYGNLAWDNVAWHRNPSSETGRIQTNLDPTTDTSSEKFDASKVKVIGDVTGLQLQQDRDYKIVVEKFDGAKWNAATVADLQTAGIYRVSVVVNATLADASGNAVTYGGGTGNAYIYVNIRHYLGAHVFINIDGKNVGNNASSHDINNIYYTGENHKLNVRVKSDENSSAHGADLTAGTDYTVAITKNGAAATNVLYPGNYVVTVTAKNSWHFTTPSVANYSVDTSSFTVRNMVVKASLNKDGQLPYHYNSTSAASTPLYAWNNGKPVKVNFDFTDVNRDNKTVSLPTSAYKVIYQKVVKTVAGHDVVENVANPTEAGKYNAIVVDNNSDDNYDVQFSKSTFVVTTDRAFDDVPVNSYYNKSVYNLADKGIVHGVGGSRTFAPMRNLKRSEAAVLIYNIALNNAKANEIAVDGQINHDAVDETNVLKYAYMTTVDAPFKDISNLNQGDTRAVAWAVQAGVITGYGTGYNKNNLFKPDQFVSRQEFATMINRYASKLDGYKAGAADALKDFPDESQVADWAKKGLDWAATNKVVTGLNGNIRPTWNIVRADAAVMLDRSGLIK